MLDLKYKILVKVLS